jgi:hypothetical protein
MYQESGILGSGGSKPQGQSLTFVERVKARHGDRIDCSQVVFVDMATSVIVSCFEHGEYLAKPRTLLEYGTGCKECAKEARLEARRKTMQEMLASGVKKCSKCKEVKSHAEFAKTKDKPSGMVSHCKSCIRNKYKALWEEGLIRDSVYQRKYGISLAEYHRLFDEQKGACKICGATDPCGNGSKNKRLYVDHCHDTGVVRGLLCHHCNVGLGSFKDDVNTLAKAIEYLSQNRAIADGCATGSHRQD